MRESSEAVGGDVYEVSEDYTASLEGTSGVAGPLAARCSGQISCPFVVGFGS